MLAPRPVFKLLALPHIKLLFMLINQLASRLLAILLASQLLFLLHHLLTFKNST